MSDIGYSEYWTEVEEIADGIIEEMKNQNLREENEIDDYLSDHGAWEAVDGHQWIIYNAYNQDVIKHSDNEDYWAENFGEFSNPGDYTSITNQVAFGALYGDVQDKLWDKVKEYKDEIEEQDEAVEDFEFEDDD